MTYELAKQLKDAGFPLKPASMEDGKDSKRKYQMFEYGLDSIGRNGIWLYPTLSELIEACDNSLFALSRTKHGTRTNWYCVYNNSLLDKALLETKEYATPEEAVANLWLALNVPTSTSPAKMP